MGEVFNDPSTSKVFVVDSAMQRVWDTDYPPVNWMPVSSRITLSGFTISFPDFSKGGAYGYNRYPFAGTEFDTCISICGLVPQFWTSGWSTVATVPLGCNAIDVRGTVTRTKNPSQNLSSNVSNLLYAGGETVFVGGWCPVEGEFTWVRVFEFRLNGNNVQFRRSQSTRQATSGEVPSWTSDYNTPGWSWWGAPDIVPVGQIDLSNGELGGGGSRRRGGDLGCSMNTSGFDFSSVYTGTITIRPGYIAP